VARLERRLGDGDAAAIGPDQLPMLERCFRTTAGIMAYCGIFSVRGNEVVHRIENSSFPEWIGTDPLRTFEFSELQLSGDAGRLVQHLN
jgi:hypothetical protein